jgi:hypothetical protein
VRDTWVHLLAHQLSVIRVCRQEHDMVSNMLVTYGLGDVVRDMWVKLLAHQLRIKGVCRQKHDMFSGW